MIGHKGKLPLKEVIAFLDALEKERKRLLGLHLLTFGPQHIEGVSCSVCYVLGDAIKKVHFDALRVVLNKLPKKESNHE
jgi:hypothetical protein